MKLKSILLMLTGFALGVMSEEAIMQLRWRNVSIGGELFFLPMVLLLIWFGWTIRSEWSKAKRGRLKNGSSRRK